MKYKLVTLVFLFASISLMGQIPYNNRYTSPVFDNIEINTDVIYGNAPRLLFPYLLESLTVDENLLMDIYQPLGDTLSKRPVLLCVHSGAFLTGSKLAEDMVAFCDSMAHRGYVTASIDYRLGMNPLSSESAIRAVYRGLQDGRSAIRFLKENRNVYNIDTNNIYMLGSSAGSFVGLHNIFLDTEDERPPETYSNPDLGCLDCSGNNYSHLGKSNGLVGLWGSLQDTILIVETDTIPVLLVHGTDDDVVPFGYGAAFGNPAFPASYGSELIAERIENLGGKLEKYFVLGVGHEFYGTSNGNWPVGPNEYWDTVFNKTVTFSHLIHRPSAGFYLEQFENNVSFYDQSQKANNWYWDFGDGNYSMEQNPTHSYDNLGTYNIIQFVSNDLNSWDTVSATISLTVGINEDQKPNLTIYPNPTQTDIFIQNYDSEPMNVTIFNIQGLIINEIQIPAKRTHKLSVVEYLPGVYFLKYRNTRGVATKMFSKIR
ncbi:MAG: T9SS type A sorting domain-containing protein [Bacteroidales bacterium]|jgi:hypothetical protein|nr:T9SS type A sorting domain-containing protein [Bacteroidales bacterium]MDG1902458.1 T9SS type A sorting domain-containing protein [Bacteroidales bacterium]MDG2081928.1 T9SS type A sorting domain-containing protein [Bacteroidales bacterium]